MTLLEHGMHKGELIQFNEKQKIAYRIFVLDLIRRLLSEAYSEIKKIVNLTQEEDSALNEYINNVRRKDNNLLHMYIGGEGGTGKSFISNAVKQFFIDVDRKCIIQAAAFTGSASNQIKGSTLHSLLGFGVGKDDSTDIISHDRLEKLRTVWKDIQYLVVDETSMVDLYNLGRFAERIYKLKNCPIWMILHLAALMSYL